MIIYSTKDYSPWILLNVHRELIPCFRAINYSNIMVQKNKLEDWLLQGRREGGVGPKPLLWDSRQQGKGVGVRTPARRESITSA